MAGQQRVKKEAVVRGAGNPGKWSKGCDTAPIRFFIPNFGEIPNLRYERQVRFTNITT